MASDGCNRSRCLVNWISAARTTNDRLCMLQFEQRAVGHLGSLCRSVCVNSLANLSFPHEPSGAKEKFEGDGKGAESGLTVASSIAFFGVRTQ